MSEPTQSEPTQSAPTSSEPSNAIEPWLREILRCPRCKGEITDASGPQGPELVCASCSLAYPVEAGVPVLLADLARQTS